jgi:hypothetical protein
MAVQIGTLTHVPVRQDVRLPARLYVAAAVAALLVMVLSLVGPIRVVQDGLSVATVGRAADGCVIEATYLPTETSYLPVSALVCWDRDANLQVLSPERAR